MQWIVSIIYGLLLAFVVLGVVAFVVQGLSGQALGALPILVVVLLGIGVVRALYPLCYQKGAR